MKKRKEKVSSLDYIMFKIYKKKIEQHEKEKKFKKEKKQRKQLLIEELKQLREQTKERFVNVVGYDGLYQIGDKGSVISLDRESRGNNGSIYTKIGKVKTVSANRDGYLSTAVTDNDGVTKRIDIHRLVSLAWIPNPHDKPCVNHKDGIKSNNCKENLEWVTYSENTQHAYDNDLMKKGELHVHAKLTNADVIKIKNSKLLNKSLATLFNCSEPQISRIKNGLRWRHMN